MSKITLITTEYPPFFGGVGAYYYNLVNSLSEFRDIRVIADIKNLSNDQACDKVEYINLFNQHGPLKWLKIISIIRKLPKETIIWAGQLLPVGSACLLAKFLFNYQYFISLHGLDWQTAQKLPRKKLLAELVLNQAKFITVNSQATLQLLPAKYQKKAVVVYPAVNINNNDFDNSLIAKYNLYPQKYFLTVGRLVARKGQIQALNSWSKINHDYKYVIVGDGPLLSEITSLINKNNLQERVILITNATNQQTSALYQNAYAFLFPVQPLTHDSEGFGIVCLEAQSYNLPVITTACGGVPEAVGDGALLMAKADEDEIVLNVNRLIEDKVLYANLQAKGKENLTSFSWKKSAKIINDLIKKYEQ